MRKLTSSATLWLAGMALIGAAAFGSPTTEVEKYLNGLATWSADFTQTIDDGHGKGNAQCAGKLYLQKPGKFRWDYSQPSSS